jgi:hypothetical protein
MYGCNMDDLWMILTRMNADRNMRERERERERGSEDKTQWCRSNTFFTQLCLCFVHAQLDIHHLRTNNQQSEAAMATAMRILHASSSVVTSPQACAGPAPPQQSTLLRCAWKGKAVRVPAFAASTSQLGNVKKSARCSFGPSGGTGG